MNIKKAYSFDDVLLVPKHSSIRHRNTYCVDVSVDLGKGIKLEAPLISANMKSVVNKRFAKRLAELGGLALFHRFYNPLEKQIEDWLEVTEHGTKFVNNIGCSFGLGDEHKKLAEKAVSVGVKVLCLDVAHADSDSAFEMTEWLSKSFSNCLLIVGNVISGRASYQLSELGADVIKCGIGSSGICTTRINTGNGYPQLSSLEECYNWSFVAKNKDLSNTDSIFYKIKQQVQKEKENQNKRRFKIISDGGHKFYGDVGKSLCFSDAVMLGNMFARSEEAAGETIVIDSIKYKKYAGSSTHKNRNVEGVSGLVKVEGTLEEIVDRIVQNLLSTCSYQNAKDLIDLKLNPEFVEISHAGWNESKPHSILMM